MSKLGMYLTRNTEYCAETRNLIEDVIRSIAEQNDFLSTDAKKAILRDALQGMGFNEEQLTAFAKCEVPAEYKVVPVEVAIRRNYTIYMRVPAKSSAAEVRHKTINEILEHNPKDIDLTPDFPLEEDDILETYIRWDDAQDE